MCSFMIKRCYVAAFVIGCTLQSCQLVPEVLPVHRPEKEVVPPEKEVAPPTTSTSTLFLIPQGAHYSTNNTFKQVRVEDHLRFAVTFDSTAIYSTTKPANQGDINKLYGFSDCASDHHTNSARFGWRWYENRLELHAYAYANKVRKSAYVGEVTLGKATVCEIKLEGDQYVFTVNGKTVSLPRVCNGIGEGYQLYPYFGGDETAPHNISIAIQTMP